MVALSLLYKRGVAMRTRLWVFLNIVCFSYFAIMTISTTILCWSVILPHIYKDETDKLWNHRLFIGYIFLNAVGNCFMCMNCNTRVQLPTNKKRLQHDGKSSPKNSKDNSEMSDKSKNRGLSTLRSRKDNCGSNLNGGTNSIHTLNQKQISVSHDTELKVESGNVLKSKQDKSNETEDDHKENKILPIATVPFDCARCEQESPARAHHCPLCQTCILKRDHHCFFMTVCVGYYNQKYFIMHCFYMMIGTLYGMFLIAIHLKKFYNVTFYGPQTFLTLFLDTLFKLTTNLYPSVSYVLLILMLYGCLFAGLTAGGLWFWQVQITLSGQTTREALKGCYQFSKSKMLNFTDVFGRFWMFSLFIPLPLPNLSNGHYSS